MTEKEIEMKLEEYKGLLISTAKRYYLNEMTFDDIYQELCMEFVKALKKHDENGNANLKTLFITYAKNWFKVKIKSQNYQKRGVPLRIDDENIENTDLYSFTMSKDYTPDEIEYQERLVEDIRFFLDEHKWGNIFLEVEENGKTLREIAIEKGISFQAIGRQYLKVKEELLNYLRERGYDL
jgi:RNA polymerase sigma factor (sigma-70 family)